MRFFRSSAPVLAGATLVAALSACGSDATMEVVSTPSGSSSDTASAPPTKPTVSLEKGEVTTDHAAACAPTCRYLKVTVSGFAPGKHTLTMHPAPWCDPSDCTVELIADATGAGLVDGYFYKQDGYLTDAYADVDGVRSPAAGF